MKNKLSQILFTFFDNLIWILVVASLIIFSLMSEGFRRPYNLVNLMTRTAPLGMLIIGQAFTMITGNFDLSSESGLGLTAMIGGLLLAAEKDGGLGIGLNPFLTIGIMIAVGLLIGVINGFLITRLRMNNLIVTIAMLMILRGLVYIISPGSTASFFPDSFKWLGSGALVTIPQEKGVLAVPVSNAFIVIMFFIAYIITRYTQFGRNMYAVGSNITAAKDAGIDADKIIRQVYIISGFCMAIAGLLSAGRYDSATPRVGAGMIFPTQAAAVIGGISLFGGRGTMIGGLGGFLLWSILEVGLPIVNVSPFWIEATRGFLLLFAVGLDAFKVMRLRRRALAASLAESEIGLADENVVID